MAEENKEHYVFLFFSIHLLCMLNAVAADAANAVLTVEITKRRRKKRRTTFRQLLHSRSELGGCDLLLTELRATDTQMYANFTRVSPAEFDFLLCAIREQITGFGLWRRPGLCGFGLLSMAHADSFQWIQSLQYSAVPRNRYVDLSTSHACRQRDVIGCNNLRSWIFLCKQCVAIESKIFYDGIYLILFYCYRSVSAHRCDSGSVVKAAAAAAASATLAETVTRMVHPTALWLVLLVILRRNRQKF